MDGAFGLYIGISRSGKTTPIKALLNNKKAMSRVLVWDAKREYIGLGLTPIYSLSDLVQTLKKTKGAGRFAYVPKLMTSKEFDGFCRLASIWNRQKPITLIAEELAAVTNVAKASGYWGILVNQGLGAGLHLHATVQRGQEVDKSIINNASYLYVCQHSTDDDAKYIAKKLGVPVTEIPREKLRFFVWVPGQGIIERAKIEYKSGKKKARHNEIIEGAKPYFYTMDSPKRALKIAKNGLLAA